VVVGRAAAVLSECHPYGVAVPRDRSGPPRIVVRVDDHALDLREAAHGHTTSDLLNAPTLDPLLAAGPRAWAEVRRAVAGWVTEGPELTALNDLELLLPFTVADYVDFYASEHHATNVGEILRPGRPPLQTNWHHQPIGYHGRAGTVVVSGTPVIRPSGHVAGTNDTDIPQLRPTTKLDVEVEVGYVVGAASTRGKPVPINDFTDHVFGVVLLNDWSARDIQRWETVPLGPFLGKSFLTSVSPWVVPLDALSAARVPVASAGSDLSAYLFETEPWGLDISLELRVNGEVVSRPPYRTMHFSPAQMMAHLTVNGASLRTGDLYASGTVSGPEPDQVGSLLERWADQRYLDDGDEVVITATAPSPDGSRLDLGSVVGRVAQNR
jgi:fumarylacetoacetase